MSALASIRRDVRCAKERDPAARSTAEVLLPDDVAGVNLEGSAAPVSATIGGVELASTAKLDGRKLKPAKVTLDDVQVLRFVLTEGRNRQIRRMCELVELEVVDLVRVRIGPLLLGDLPEGKWRHLTAAERDALIAASV